jgi:hypothetical protein
MRFYVLIVVVAESAVGGCAFAATYLPLRIMMDDGPVRVSYDEARLYASSVCLVMEARLYASYIASAMRHGSGSMLLVWSWVGNELWSNQVLHPIASSRWLLSSAGLEIRKSCLSRPAAGPQAAGS